MGGRGGRGRGGGWVGVGGWVGGTVARPSMRARHAPPLRPSQSPNPPTNPPCFTTHIHPPTHPPYPPTHPTHRYLLRDVVVTYLTRSFPKWTAVDKAMETEG